MMRTHVAPKCFRSIGLAAATALLACGGALVDDSAQPGTPGAPGTVLVPDDAAPSVTLTFAALEPAGAVEGLASAAIDDTPTLYVVAEWKGVPAGAVERLVVAMPGGAVYASLELPVGETERGDVRFQVLEDGTRRLTFLLHVWGTPIESLRMTGAWTATATLVGGTATATASVTLE
ncbi:MAG TPA: hypothetical protein VEB43_19860 [Anaeromyxobacter sp.]|nr:hypothetical protein [Anaeromyxobacter sp.]